MCRVFFLFGVVDFGRFDGLGLGGVDGCWDVGVDVVY